jgi:hypothetical protein
MMSFEDWIRTQTEVRAVVSVRLGLADDGSHASLMTWSDKVRGTWFWAVDGNETTLVQFVGDEPNPAEICHRCMRRRDRHPDNEICGQEPRWQ